MMSLIFGPVWQHTFVSPSAFSRRAVVSYWRKYVHEVLVNRLGGLSLPRKSVVRLTDHPDMTLDVYRGRKTTIQQLIFGLFTQVSGSGPLGPLVVFFCCCCCSESCNHRNKACEFKILAFLVDSLIESVIRH